MTSNVLNQTIIHEWNIIAPINESDLYGGTEFTFTDIPPYMNIHPNSTYFVNFLSAVAASNALPSIFTGTAEGGSEGNKYTTQFIEALWTSWDDMGQLMSNLARSMTNNVRQTSPAAPYTMYAGTAYREVVLVDVRWAWLLLPVAPVLCSIVFLILSILQTRSSGVNAWKSSTLALLFSNVESNLKDTSRYCIDETNGLLKVVGRSKVILQKRDGLLEFKNSIPIS
jgi:hypothetical protein